MGCCWAVAPLFYSFSSWDSSENFERTIKGLARMYFDLATLIGIFFLSSL
jgi:hypothetical protein